MTALNTLLTDTLAGDIGALIMLAPFLITPLMVGGLVVEAVFPYNYRLARRTYAPEWSLLLIASPAVALMGYALHMILVANTLY